MDTVDALTPTWLDRALDLSGPRSVTGLEQRPLGTGQMCDSHRIRLTHADGTGSSLIAKFPSSDPSSRSTGLLLRAYEKEIRFYQQLAPTLPVRTPTAHVAAIDADSGSFVLLLDDLDPARPGDQLAGCDLTAARAALGELVGLHAPRWGDPALADIEWLVGDRGPARDMMIGLLGSMWTGFVDRYRDRLEAHVLEAGAIVFDRLEAFYRDREPTTIIHGDFRLDNLMFHPDGTVTVLDWQTCTVGPGPADAAYFVGAGLLPELRRAHEVELFEHYHRGLVDAGVVVDRDDCWSAYRRGTWAGLVMAVGASMLVERTERGDDMFMAMASRHALQALDLDAGELLDD